MLNLKKKIPLQMNRIIQLVELERVLPFCFMATKPLYRVFHGTENSQTGGFHLYQRKELHRV